MGRKLRDATVSEAVSIIKKYGAVEINPLKYRRQRLKNACFEAAARGLVKKTRINCGLYVFEPLEEAPNGKKTFSKRDQTSKEEESQKPV